MLRQENIDRLALMGCQLKDLGEVIEEVEKMGAKWDVSGEVGQKVVSREVPDGTERSYGEPGYIGEIEDAFIDMLVELIKESTCG